MMLTTPLRRADAQWRRLSWLAKRGLSGGPRVAARRLLRVLWWTVTGQLRTRLAGRRVADGWPPNAAVEDVLAARFSALRPLSVFPEPGAGRRLTLLTDGFGPGSLFGGVGTAILLAASLARRLDCALRVVTRTEAPDPERFGAILRLHGLNFAPNVEFMQSHLGPNARGVPIQDGDLMLTTSWWTTWAAMRAVAPQRILYLIQEDERLFYPAGEDQLRCSEVLADRRLRFVVNTAMLHAHFAAEGFESIASRGVSFEPAFPASVYFRGPRPTQGRRRFFFYARPNHLRNLFYRGLEAVAASIEANVLPPEVWDFYFVGQNIPSLVLPRGARLIRQENLAWADYAALVGSIEVGLALMATPHPSYPPLDLAASGAVVVTNRFGRKTSLESFSPNIICTECGVLDLVDGLQRAIQIADDEPLRARHAAAAGISRDWGASFGPVLDQLEREL
jgi:hypothetical protein